MRKVDALGMWVAASLAGVSLAAGAAAQQVRTPSEIAAALGAGKAKPAAAADDDSIPVGDERAFSLACTGVCGGSAKPSPSTVRVAPRGYARSAAAPTPGRGGAHRRAAGAAAPRAPRSSLDMQLTFATGSAELDAEARRRIDPFAVALTQANYGLAGNSFRVEGHTDSVGNRSSNLDLSRRRAQSVVDYLVAKGVPASRLTGKGFGPDAPLSGLSANNGANRRVEIIRN